MGTWKKAQEYSEEGQGHCQHGQVYASAAWELASSSDGQKGFSTSEYAAWRDEAWNRCLQINSQVKFVSVWTDAGYRCYTSSTCLDPAVSRYSRHSPLLCGCSPNGAGNTKTWKKAQEYSEEGQGH